MIGRFEMWDTLGGLELVGLRGGTRVAVCDWPVGECGWGSGGRQRRLGWFHPLGHVDRSLSVKTEKIRQGDPYAQIF
jgi:hypothetical protein